MILETVAGKAGTLLVKEAVGAITKKLDVNSQLKAGYGDAINDMCVTAYSFVRSLTAARLGVAPRSVTEAQIERFLEELATSPGFGARFARLFTEGIKSPTEARRQMLARVLFATNQDEDERDRVDLAIERLVPSDIECLEIVQKFTSKFKTQLVRRSLTE
jgi:hypothetical protein